MHGCDLRHSAVKERHESEKSEMTCDNTTALSEVNQIDFRAKNITAAPQKVRNHCFRGKVTHFLTPLAPCVSPLSEVEERKNVQTPLPAKKYDANFSQELKIDTQSSN